MAKIALELDKLTSLNFWLRVLRWVAWTIWSDACLLDQIIYVIFVYNRTNVDYSFASSFSNNNDHSIIEQTIRHGSLKDKLCQQVISVLKC